MSEAGSASTATGGLKRARAIFQNGVSRQDFIRSALTRDLPNIGISIPPEQLRRFWTMLAHYHAQTWNVSEIAGSLGLDYKTAQRYLDILTGAFLVRPISSWTENLGKRVRKAPKIYIRDSGLFHALLGIRSREELERHPKLGASCSSSRTRPRSRNPCARRPTTWA